jgi:hypothetical protein
MTVVPEPTDMTLIDRENPNKKATRDRVPRVAFRVKPAIYY